MLVGVPACACVFEKFDFGEGSDRGSVTRTVPAIKTTPPTLKVTFSTQPFPLSHFHLSFNMLTHFLLPFSLSFCLCPLSHPLFLYSVVSFLPFTPSFLIMHGPHLLLNL